LAATFLIVAFASAPALAQYDGFTKASRDVQMSFPLTGRVIEINFKHGDRVKKGDELIKLNDKLGEAQIEKLKLAFESNIVIEQQQAELDMAKVQLKLTSDLHRKGAAGNMELRRAEVQKVIEALGLEKAKFDQQIVGKDLERAEADHARYAIKALGDGIVERVDGEEVEVGETVQANQPVVRLINVDELIVDVDVRTRETLALKLNDPAWVRCDLPGHDRPVRGKITRIAMVAEVASGTTRVRVIVANKENYLGAGWHVNVFFTKPDQPLAKAAPAKPHPERH
jgi:RND family efflux transporter MFP subunit